MVYFVQTGNIILMQKLSSPLSCSVCAFGEEAAAEERETNHTLRISSPWESFGLVLL